MVSGKKLNQFVMDLIKKRNEEMETEQEKSLWELWLHKELEGNPSWIDFRNDHLPRAKVETENEPTNYGEIVMQSENILDEFKVI